MKGATFGSRTSRCRMLVSRESELRPWPSIRDENRDNRKASYVTLNGVGTIVNYN